MAMLKIFLACICISFAFAGDWGNTHQHNDRDGASCGNRDCCCGCPHASESPRSANAVSRLAFAQAHGLCKVNYQGQCFFGKFESLGSQVVNYSSAERLCKEHGAKPANVYSYEHYVHLINYLKGEVLPRCGDPYVTAWLGMQADPLMKTCFLSDGMTPAPFLRWFSDYPREGPMYSAHTGMVVRVPKCHSCTLGMLNSPTDDQYHGVLCELTTP